MSAPLAPAPAPARGWLAALKDSPLAAGAMLGLFSLITAALLALADDRSRAPIAARQAEDLAASLEQVIAPGLHDNDLAASQRLLSDAEAGEVLVYVAARSGVVTGVAFEMVGYGYSGAIRVLMAVAPDGTILGVRVLAHAETPGLGDKIERAKGDWIEGFTGRSASDPGPEGWKVKRDGGTFDQFAGATITPRAVVGAVHRGLLLFGRHRAALLATADPNP